jgi:ABC-type multidrug transport system fused ATPase/permease subunit
MEFLDAAPAIASGARELPTGPLGIRYRGVRVNSRGENSTAILDDLTFEVAPGETVALVGATGSGKSALVSLLPRLLDPSAGHVEVGSEVAGFVDVREVDLIALRHHVHVSTQDCFLFSDTLAENVRLAAPQASDDEVRQALHLAAADEILTDAKDGLATRLGDRGITLSGGQRQRVALARALLAKPSILILDDSTSALDALTEQRILHNIRNLNAGTTLLLVASKPSTVMFADRILVLENGRIVAEGRHAELSRSSSTYRELLGIEDGN